jgi:hypothetical protein
VLSLRRSRLVTGCMAQVEAGRKKTKHEIVGQKMQVGEG